MPSVDGFSFSTALTSVPTLSCARVNVDHLIHPIAPGPIFSCQQLGTIVNEQPSGSHWLFSKGGFNLAITDRCEMSDKFQKKIILIVRSGIPLCIIFLFSLLFLPTIAASQDLILADAGPDQAVSDGDTVILDGSNSLYPAFITAYFWEQTGGSPSVILKDVNTAKASFTAPIVIPEGTSLTFQLTVDYVFSYGWIWSDTDTTIVNVLFVNDPPVADAGPDQTVEEETSVTLNGSNSFDPDDGIKSYLWKQVSGPSVSLSDPEAVQPTFLAPNVGPNGEALTFELTVIDVGDLKDSNTTTVNVIGDNDAPVADAGPNQTVDEGKKVTLDGSNSTDPEGKNLSYQWSQVAGLPVTLSNTQVVKPTFTAPDVGLGGASLTFRLRVIDDGDLEESDTTIVNVRFVNEPPVADAGPNQTVLENSKVTLNGSNSIDPEGENLSYQWEQVAAPLVTLSHTQVAKPTFTAPDVGAGGASLTFRITVTDNEGLKDTDTTVVNVTGDNDPPMADAGPDQMVIEEDIVMLNGSNSTDPEKDRLFYRWKQVAGSSVTLSDPAADQPKFNAPNVAPSGAALMFELTVRDSLGLKDTDDITVNVIGDNDPPAIRMMELSLISGNK